VVIRFRQSYAVAFGLVFGLALALRLIHLAEVIDTPFFRHLDNDLFEYDQWAR
jgi:hypothetical protein